MDISPDGLSATALWTCHGAFWPLVGLALAGAGRRELASALGGHLFPGALVAVLVVWHIRAPTPAGPAVHLLGATLLTLVFGWRLALAGLAVVVAATMVHGTGGWASLGANGLLSAAVPVAASQGVLELVRRRLPPNPFAYILGAGFLAGGVAMAAVGLASTALLLAASGASARTVLDYYAVSYVLLVFPEAFVTGGIIAWLVMFYPHWVRTYDARYPVHE